MSTNSITDNQSEKQGDRLLWLAASVVVGIALTWLGISQLGSSGMKDSVPADRVEPQIPLQPTVKESSTPAPESGLDNPLRMARLAYDAGMLVEPEDYSAWTLYASVVEQEPDNVVARQGLEKVAADLLQRGAVALEQGRFDDARSTAERILATLPDHSETESLVAEIEQLAPRPAPDDQIVVPPTAAEPELVSARPEQPVIEPTPVEPEVDPIVENNEAFMQALIEDRLLTPVDGNAKYYVQAMMSSNVDHELTQVARRTLADELLMRSTQALEALDANAARTWIDEADSIAVDRNAVDAARQRLTDHLIAMESTKPLPASALSIVEYVPPNYPGYALDRGIDGWVDLEFIVTIDGSTRDIVVADASNRNVFSRDAVKAVEQWRFEPRVFMNQTIEQQSYTTIRFAFEQ